MAYAKRNNLISRAGYSGVPGVGDIWDSITGAAGTVVKFYGAEQQAVGAAAATSQQNKDLTAALAAKAGIGTSTIVVVGGLALVGYLLLRKKRE